ncbi:MAG: elongation factor P [Brevundimonas sp.]|jgi:elongation factor P
MAKINGNTIKPGMVLQHNGGLWVVTKASHVKPGKGGAFANVEAKNLETGNKLNERFRSEDKVERVTLEQKDFSYLYEQGDALVFMDDVTYEQIELQKDWVGEDSIPYLQDGMKVVIEMHEDRPIGLSLPEQVTLTVAETEPTVKGQTASSSYKPAIADNGVRIMIPPYMGPGERIIVDTSTGEYVRRAD